MNPGNKATSAISCSSNLPVIVIFIRYSMPGNLFELEGKFLGEKPKWTPQPENLKRWLKVK
jgi:hypothetical protein